MSAPDPRALERIELSALADFFAAARDRDQTSVFCEPVGGALLTAWPDGPAVMFNRASGLGLDRAATRDDLDRIIERGRGLGLPWSVAVAPHALPGELERWLRDAGFEPGWAWMKFSRSTGSPPRGDTDLTVVEAGPEDARAFADVVAAGNGMPAGGGRLAAVLPGRAGWRCFVARDGERAVAAGAVFVSDGLAWLGWGTTLPSHRRRGAQGALLAARIAAAAEAGAHTAVSETGERIPGRPDASYRNLLRAGFEERYVRPNLRCPDYEQLARAQR